MKKISLNDSFYNKRINKDDKKKKNKKIKEIKKGKDNKNKKNQTKNKKTKNNKITLKKVKKTNAKASKNTSVLKLNEKTKKSIFTKIKNKIKNRVSKSGAKISKKNKNVVKRIKNPKKGSTLSSIKKRINKGLSKTGATLSKKIKNFNVKKDSKVPKKNKKQKKESLLKKFINGIKSSTKKTKAKVSKKYESSLIKLKIGKENILGMLKNSSKKDLTKTGAILDKRGKSKNNNLIKKLKKMLSNDSTKTGSKSSKKYLSASVYIPSSSFQKHLRKAKLGKKASKIERDGFTTQGYTVVGNNSLIAAYKKGKKSRIYVFDKVTNKYKGVIKLDNHSHVGGLAYDNKNKLLFITGSKKIKNMPEMYTYNFNKIIKKLEKSNKNEYKVKGNDLVKGTEKLTTGKITKKNSSSITFGKGSLYAGTFDTNGTIVKIKYKYDQATNSIKSATSKKIGEAGFGIQGMTYNKKKNSIISSTSNFFSKYSEISNFDLSKRKVTGTSIVNTKGLQGIVIDNQGVITGVSEYGSNKGKAVKLDISSDLTSVATQASVKVSPSLHSALCFFTRNKIA